MFNKTQLNRGYHFASCKKVSSPLCLFVTFDGKVIGLVDVLVDLSELRIDQRTRYVSETKKVSIKKKKTEVILQSIRLT